METTTPTSPAPQVGQVYESRDGNPFAPHVRIEAVKSGFVQYSVQMDDGDWTKNRNSASASFFLGNYILRSPAP